MMTVPEIKKYKHLTFDDRVEIQEGLNRALTFKAIARIIGKDQTTVSKEVKRHIELRGESVLSYGEHGGKVYLPACPSHMKAPFVCNPCKDRRRNCNNQKRFYNAKLAQKAYENLLVEAREGIPLNKESFYEMDELVTKCLDDGQRLYHIMQTHDLGVSKSTVSKKKKKGYLSASPFDFPRVLKFKARRQKRGEYVPKGLKVGRAYVDFRAYIEEKDISSWVEMDTVIGKRTAGKAIVTFDFTFCNFMFGLLIERRTAAEVAEKIELLKAKLTSEGIRFGDVFPILLTDNGGEFANVFAIENDADGDRETRMFFCDPSQSSQKSKVEKNHTLFRDIVPKGTPFDDYSQDTVDLIFSHVNGVKRKIFNGKSPYEMFVFTFGEAIAKILGIEYVPPHKVIQSPKLLLK
jgi:IS30 family transposase